MADARVAIGEKIRQLRDKKGLSLEQTAQRTEMSPELLADIEAGRVSPPLGQIVALANAFKVSLGDLFGDSADAPYCIVRKDERRQVSRFGEARDTAAGYSYQSLGFRKQNRHMEPFLVTLTPGQAPKEPNRHDGEEILFVLEGQVEVSLAGHTDILDPGDFIYYDSTLPHIVACHGEQPATLFAVIYARREMIL